MPYGDLPVYDVQVLIKFITWPDGQNKPKFINLQNQIKNPRGASR